MVDAQEPPTPSPPRSRHTRRRGPTRFEKEAAATGGKSAADQPGDPKVIGPWRIGRTIGKGASGRVKIAKHSRTGQYAAIKIVPKHALLFSSRMSIVDAGNKLDKAVLGIEREIVIMKLIDHPNVMALYDVWETAKELYLVLEYVEGGELFDYLVSQGRLPADEASRYFQQIVAGVDYCHRFNICHRDLKPENLLLDCDRNIKIADFGMAALEPSDRLLETSCGSPHYASPEIVAGMSYHGAASDIWSCGVILFALLTGRLPFDDENIRLLLQKVKSGRFIMPADLPADAKDLITRMLVVDPEKRITMAEINKHPFCQRRQDTDSGRRLHVVEPPRLDQIARPVKSEKEIDKDTLRNLRTLWCGSSERAIVRALLTPEKTWEKAFYYLLLQYRNKHLENFNPDPEHYRNSTGDISESEPRPEGASRRSARPLSEVKRVAGSKENQIPTLKDRSTVSSPHRATRPPPKSPNTPSRVGGPRSPSPRPKAKAAVAPIRGLARQEPSTKASAAPPRILLQRPTPEPEEGRIASQSRPKGLGLSMPSPTPASGSTSPGSPAASPVPGSPLNPMGNIAVPQVQDAALQKFFHDIAEQLQLIGSNSPRSSLIGDNLPSPALSMGESTTPSTPISTPVSLPLELPTMTPAGEVGTKPRRPGYERAVTDTAMSTPKADQDGPVRRRSYLVDASARENILAGSVNSSERRGRHSLHSGKAVLDQSKRRAKPPPLDLSSSPKATQAEFMLSPTSSPFLGPPCTSSALPSPLVAGPSSEIKQSWFSNLFSWKPAVFTLMSADDWASSRAECMRLLETFGVSVRLEDAEGWGVLKCRLEDIRDVSGIIIAKPVRFRIEFLPHATWPTATGSLASQSSTVSSTSSPVTSTRKVGPAGSKSSANNVGSDGNGITTSMTLVQEKGALSSFKAVYGRLRAEWRLDTLKSPAVVGNSRFASSPLASPALSSDTAQAMWS